MSDKKKSGNIVPDITYEESAVVGASKVRGKKVIILDADGNQVTNFGTDVSELATSAKQDDIITALGTKRNYEYMGKQTSGDYTYFGFKERGSVEWKIMRKDDTDASSWAYAYSEASANSWSTAWGDPASESYSTPPDS